MKYSHLLIISLLVANCTQKFSALEPAKVPAAKPSVSITASFPSIALLPRCDNGSERMNAYISEKDEFVQCLNLFWRRVRPGDVSGKFIARESPRFYEWTDAATRKRWALPKQSEIALGLVQGNICKSGWKLPTEEELAEASINGLFEGLKSRGGVAFDKAWTANLQALRGLSTGTLLAVAPEADNAVTAGVYCVASLNLSAR